MLELILANQSFQKMEQLTFWEIPEDTTQEQWQAGHKQLLVLQQICKTLLPKSQAFGIRQFGVEVYIDAVTDFQLEFGIEPPPEPQPRLEGDEAVLDMLERGFQRWVEKSGDYEQWDHERLNRALRMLEPLAEQAGRIKELLNP
jgi:hypothetical protein